MLKQLLIVAAVVRNGYCLVCLESSDTKGDQVVVEKNSTSFKYCVMVPKGLDADSAVKLFPLEAESDAMISSYDRIFAEDESLFQTLTICLFERYSLAGHEFMLRCMCNYDRCNDAKSMRGFLNKLAVKSVKKI